MFSATSRIKICLGEKLFISDENRRNKKRLSEISLLQREIAKFRTIFLSFGFRLIFFFFFSPAKKWELIFIEIMRINFLAVGSIRAHFFDESAHFSERRDEKSTKFLITSVSNILPWFVGVFINFNVWLKKIYN